MLLFFVIIVVVAAAVVVVVGFLIIFFFNSVIHVVTKNYIDLDFSMLSGSVLSTKNRDNKKNCFEMTGV